MIISYFCVRALTLWHRALIYMAPLFTEVDGISDRFFSPLVNVEVE